MGQKLPGVEAFFAFCWEGLSREHKDDLISHSQPRNFKNGDIILPYKGECLGLMLVQSGQFRAFVLSSEGKEVTLYRLFDLDICLFSASCILNNIQFDIQIQAEKETKALLIPSSLYERLMNQSAAIANYTNQLMSSRFSDVMWTLEQVLFKSMDSRIAQFLLEYANIEGTNDLMLTHEAIARDLGTAREVVTRMLKYFTNEHLLELTRGRIRLLDIKRLREIAG
ncbi:hypothetical protein SDC9_121062 [bioreactor metagenome]|uniref:HTH crp-type domain-containing protein n=1 Tax=bioreactor metagenome TaxID=1076179 RepID=A0A645CAW7_9ZZZZ|nr:Crp/Fnr family transcriptional regulator [Candidatus Pelethousia sp.]